MASPLPWLDRLASQSATFTFREPAPDPESLVMFQRVLQALRPDLAASADPLGFPRRSPFLREESLRIRLRAQRAILPALLLSIICVDAQRVVHQRDDDVCHCTPPARPDPRVPPLACTARELHE